MQHLKATAIDNAVFIQLPRLPVWASLWFSRSGNQATRWVDYSELTTPNVGCV
jgi:hypothetical protein